MLIDRHMRCIPTKPAGGNLYSRRYRDEQKQSVYVQLAHKMWASTPNLQFKIRMGQPCFKIGQQKGRVQ